MFESLIRRLLHKFPEGWALPIVTGPLRGKRWILSSHTLGCWWGTYERPETSLFQQRVREGNVVYDIGANVGFYTLWASIRVGKLGRVVAIEPLSENLRYLEQHLSLNKISNVLVLPIAIGDRKDSLPMHVCNRAEATFLDPGGDRFIPVSTLDRLVFEDRLPVPHVIKIDVEGWERALLSGARRLLAEKRPLLFLSTHSSSLTSSCRAFLEPLGYSLRPIVPTPPEEAREFLGEPQ